MYLTSRENFRTPVRVHGVSKATGGPPGVIINPALTPCTRGGPAARTAAIAVVGAGRACGTSRRRRNRR